MSKIESETELITIIENVKKQSKRVLKTNCPKNPVILEEVKNNIITLFNQFTVLIRKSWNNLDELDRKIWKQNFHKIRDLTIKVFFTLRVKYAVPLSILEQIDPLITVTDAGESDSEAEIMALSTMEFFNFASKIMPNQFDGSADKLTPFLDSLAILKANSTDNASNALAFVKTRLAGRARNLILETDDLDAIALKLKNAIKRDSSRIITGKIMNNAQRNKSNNVYISEMELLVDQLRNAYIAEGVPITTAENYMADTVSRAVCLNANSERTKLILEAGNFKTTKDIFEKFANIRTDETTSSINYLNKNGHSNSFNSSYGRGRGNMQFYKNNPRYNHGGYTNFNKDYPNNNHKRGNNRPQGNNNNFRGRGRKNFYNQHVRIMEIDDENPGNSEVPNSGLGTQH